MVETMAFAADLALVHMKTGGSAPLRSMDEARFEAFYRQTAGSLWAYVYRLTTDPAAADDIVQKAFFRFLRANPTFTSDEHMRRYIFRAATNLAVDHFREKKREIGRPAKPGETAPHSDLRQDMARVFAELKPRERALLWLAHVEESSHDEIGDALGLRPKSVRVLLFRARKKLGELLVKRGVQ
jgi:RNA polymerase sigma-70 factor (ECF subfamily)